MMTMMMMITTAVVVAVVVVVGWMASFVVDDGLRLPRSLQWHRIWLPEPVDKSIKQHQDRDDQEHDEEHGEDDDEDEV